MRVALFNHPFDDFYTTPHRLQRNIPQYLSEICSNHQTMSFDVVKSIREERQLPEELAFLEPFILDDTSNYSFFKRWYRFGCCSAFNHKQLKEFDPEVIVITSFAWCYADGAVEQAHYLLKLFPGSLIVIGGGGPSANPAWYSRQLPEHLVVTGAGELTLNQLLGDIEIGKYRHGIIRPDNDTLRYSFKPFICRGSKNTILLQLTRGCPSSCTYCSVSVTAPRFLIPRPADILQVLEKLDPAQDTHLIFEDDSLTSIPDWFVELLQSIGKIIPGFTFSLENGLDFMTLDSDLVDNLVGLGITQWNISLTSTSSEVLEACGRRYSIKEFEEKIEILQSTGRKVIVYFISGLPGDMPRSILQTLLYLAGLPVLPGISTFYPVPGTMASRSYEGNLEPLECRGTSFFSRDSGAPEDLVTLFMLTRFINAVKSFTLSELIQYAEESDSITTHSSRRALTALGITQSIQKGKIVSVSAIPGQGITCTPYPCSGYLVEEFFSELQNSVILRNSNGECFKPSDWKRICRKSQ
jgi:radical SAM superfamily enzyme YgiQ (UPF0313 family)